LDFSIEDSLTTVGTYCDYLSGKEYGNLNFILDPFQVLWIGKK